MAIDLTHHDEQFSTTGQLAPEQMAEVAALGFRSVIDNRPDGEGGPAQPTAAELASAAQAHGLEFAYQPVVGSDISAADVETFARFMAELPKPALGFCRSGARSQKLYTLSKAAGRAPPTAH